MSLRGDEKREWGEHPPDPPMTDYERKILEMLRKTYSGFGYFVGKQRSDYKNEYGVAWNLDFWVENLRRATLVVKLIQPDTNLENVDMRMKDVFATLAYDRSIRKDDYTRIVIVPDMVRKTIPTDVLRVYENNFQGINATFFAEEDISDLKSVFLLG